MSKINYISVEYEVFNYNLSRRTKQYQLSRKPYTTMTEKMSCIYTDARSIENDSRYTSYLLSRAGKSKDSAKIKVKNIKHIKVLGESFYY